MPLGLAFIAETYAALFSKRRNAPVTLPNNTAWDAEVLLSRSQLSRITRLIIGSLGTNAEEKTGQHMQNGASLRAQAAVRSPSLRRCFFVFGKLMPGQGPKGPHLYQHWTLRESCAKGALEATESQAASIEFGRGERGVRSTQEKLQSHLPMDLGPLI